MGAKSGCFAPASHGDVEVPASGFSLMFRCRTVAQARDAEGC